MNCLSIAALESSLVLLEGTVTEENSSFSLTEDKKISHENLSQEFKFRITFENFKPEG